MDERTGLSPEETTTLKDLLNLAGAVAGSLSSDQVARLGGTLAEALPLLELFADPGVQRLAQVLRERAGELSEALELVAAYQRSGQLQGALELLALAGSVREALGPGVVADLARGATALACAGDRLVTEIGGIEGIERWADAAQRASADARRGREKVGVLALWSALKEPGAQQGLRFLVSLGRRLGRQ